jgi:transposase-like protein
MSPSNDTEKRAQHPLRYPLPHCPTCGSRDLEPVVESDTFDVHFLCRDCKRCWHVEFGHVHRMSPDVCHGCPHRNECRPVFDADHHRGVPG